MNIRPVRFAPWAAGARPRSSTRASRVAEARHRAAPVALAGERGPLLARDLLAPGDEPRAAPAGRDPALELGERGDPARAGPAGAAGARARPPQVPERSSAPSTSRTMTGSRSASAAGAAACAGAARRASSRRRRSRRRRRGVAKRRRAGGRARGGRCRGAAPRRTRRGSASRRAAARRAGADDLDEQRLRRVRDARPASPGRRARCGGRAPRRSRRAAVGGLAELDHELGGALVEQREDALLLVREVLVERRLRHARPRARSPRRSPRRSRRGRTTAAAAVEQAPALDAEADLQRRRVAAAGDAGRGWPGADRGWAITGGWYGPAR